jgi:hypothetical protein
MTFLSFGIRSMIFRLAVMVVFLPMIASAQQKVDCGRFFSTGCTSFNELLGAQDSVIVDAINSDEKASRVCFVDAEDDFVILTVGLPPEPWVRDKKFNAFSATRFVSFRRYKDGVFEESFFLPLTWHKFTEDGDLMASGSGTTGGTSKIHITDERTSFSSKWLNRAHTTTTFEFSIRCPLPSRPSEIGVLCCSFP